MLSEHVDQLNKMHKQLNNVIMSHKCAWLHHDANQEK